MLVDELRARGNGTGSMNGIGSHNKPNDGATIHWLTPPAIMAQLGPFDLDPCAPVTRPWPTADVHFTVDDDGLSMSWSGRVWLNPPYGRQTGQWLAKLADHGHGMALVFARTETEMFVREVWNRASALLFIDGRLHFHHADGSRAKGNAGGPSVLVAYGDEDARLLKDSGIAGAFVIGWQIVKSGAA